MYSAFSRRGLPRKRLPAACIFMARLAVASRGISTLPQRTAPMAAVQQRQAVQEDATAPDTVDMVDQPPKPVTPVRDEFWRKVPRWKDVSAEEFLSYSWGVSR